MTVCLTKSRHNLRHLQSELTVFICQRGTMALRVTFMPFSGVCPNLYTLTRKRRTIYRTCLLYTSDAADE